MEYGVRWREFDRDSKVVTREKMFKTEKARNKFVDKLEQKDNFFDLVSFLDEE